MHSYIDIIYYTIKNPLYLIYYCDTTIWDQETAKTWRPRPTSSFRHLHKDRSAQRGESWNIASIVPYIDTILYIYIEGIIVIGDIYRYNSYIVISCMLYYNSYISGWWFGTLFIFPNSWDDDPIWLIFFRGLKPPTEIYRGIIMIDDI